MSVVQAVFHWPGCVAPAILVALDYDGTLVDIVPRPADARPDEELLRLLGELAGEPGLHALLLSGRALGELERWLPVPDLSLAGSHGAEWRPVGRAPEPLLAPARARETVRAAAAGLREALGGIPGSEVEEKDLSVAAHCRNVRPLELLLWQDRFAEVYRRFSDRLKVQRGKRVLELCWPGVTKGDALREIRRREGWEGLPVLALGDDLTDEGVFQSLGDEDLTIHVGCSASAARLRVPNVAAARALLRTLIEARRAGRSMTHV
jgi:trehalose 6-phosphate synthase/phosphatase